MRFQQNNKFNIKKKLIFIFLISLSFLIVPPSLNAQKKYVVVLDAGHGGKDPGNLGNGYQEKNIALKIALLVGANLKKNKDFKIKYTRTTDVYVDLWKRGDIANEGKADLFVSIHCDSHTSNAYGAGTFVLGLRGNKKNLEIAKRENAAILLYEKDYKKKYKGFDSNSAESVIGLSLLQEENLDKSLQIASLIQHNFSRDLQRQDRKVKQDNFQVLRETIMPSVLVELGFLTNKREGKYLNSKKGQKEMSNAISAAIEKYINQLKLNTIEVFSDDKPLIEYKVQIAAGKNKLAAKSYNFKGLKNIERVKVASIFKYFYGGTSTYKEVEKSLKIAKQKGFTSAFVVAFKNGKKISVEEAKKIK
jgi:N-acetylmuramoyl-L-alanine amidase